MILEMVAFDIAGTTLKDDGVVITAFKKAFQSCEPELWPLRHSQWTQYAIDTMGQSKIKVFTDLLKDTEKAQRANIAFEAAYIEELKAGGATAIPGAEELFRYLRTKGIAIALTTGFSRTTLDVLLDSLNWLPLIDIAISPTDVGQGRPHPDMLIKAAQELGVLNKHLVAVCGDTAADMQAAIAFGSPYRFGVLTGAHDEKILLEAGATSVINSVADLSTLI